MKSLNFGLKMNKQWKKVLALIALAAVLMSVGITAVHHHLPSKKADLDCEICSFINTLNTAVLPQAVLLWILAVFAVIIPDLNNGISAQNLFKRSSRAPPAITL
jgi:hypothetical protein